MAGVSGTEVLYKRESKLGLTTLTFRKRRYLFPSVAHRDEHILSASTGDLQSRGKCVMLDVGLFCPHCAGAISARLSGSHSKLVVAKASHVEHKCIEAHCAQPQIEHCVTDHSASEGHSTTSQQWYGGKRHNAPKVKIAAGLAEETHLEIGFNSLDRHRETCQSAGKRGTADKLSSSDYESLDRDSHINTWSSYDNSTGTFNSATYSSSLTAPSRVDDAYCSMTSSQHSNTQDSLHKMSNLSQKYSSLPRDVRFPVCAKPVSEEKLILDSMDVETSDKNEAALVEELLSDDVIDEEYQNLMNASSAREEMTFGERKTINKSQETHHEMDKENLPVDEASGACRSEDSTSERSASPETFVDDVLENIESEIYTGDATLPRVFALQREGSPRKHSSRRKANIDNRIRKPGFTNGKDWPQNKTSSLKRNELHEFIKTVYNSSQKNKIIAQQDTDFSHETFFEEVVEALTDLEGGFTTDWTSDYDSDNKCRSPYTPSPERAKFHLGGEQDSQYKDIVDAYNIQRKTATSSCECIPDDRSRDLDSSTERISSTVETPSELSAGSVEGYGSSSECSYSGLGESMKEDGGLFEQIIENTKCLTEDLLVIAEDRQTSSNGSSQGLDSRIHAIPPDKRKTSVNDERARRDEAFLETGESVIQQDVLINSMSSNKGSVPVDVIRRIGPVPQIVEPGDDSEHPEPQTRVIATRHTAKSENSDEDDDVDDLDISLENLLVCNAIHCSTSDLDEPYSAELRYVSRLEGSETLQNDEESMLLSDIQNRPSNKMMEVDEFVPEMDEPPQEILRQTFDVVNDTSSCRETCKTIENEVVPRVKGTVVGADANSFHGDNNLVSKDLIKYVQSQTCKTYQSKEHNTRLDSCLDDVCQTCNFQPKGPNEIIKNEEVTTQEVTLVFVWPKKMNIPRELTQKLPVAKPKEPFRSIHLRRVMRVSDFDVDVVEGPVVETVEYRKDGSMRKSIVQRPAEKPDMKETQNSEYKESDEICTQSESTEKHQHRHSCEDIKHDDDGSRDDKADAFADETSQDKQLNDDSNSLAEVELSHYDAVNESFVMPCLDMTTSQKSEELFDLSSAASMELLSETESSVEQMYSDHQRSINAIYDRAENDSCCDGTESYSLTSVASASEQALSDESETTTTTAGPTLQLEKETDKYRKSDNVEGKDPNVKLIDQSERNVYVVSVGKYFAGKSDGPTDFADQPVSGENHPEVGSEETTCPRCENVYFVEENKEIPKTSRQLSSGVAKKQHPVPCERCLRLEREIRIKLAELSKLIEELGRRKKLSKDDRSGSIEDLESLSQETAENIKILQRSIALLNDVGDDDTPDVMFDVGGDGINFNNVDDTRVTQQYSQRRVSPVSYSTRVIKKRKAKKVTKLREIFQDSSPSAQQETAEKNHVAVPITSPGGTHVFGMQLANPEASALLRELPSTTDESTWINGSQTGRDSVQSSNDDTSVDINGSLTNKILVTEKSPSANTDTGEGVKNGPEGDKNKLETFAENLAKYIIFRAKLFIVLENPATRIPYLKNELASPKSNGNNKPVGADHERWVASDTKRQRTSLVHGHNSDINGR